MEQLKIGLNGDGSVSIFMATANGRFPLSGRFKQAPGVGGVPLAPEIRLALLEVAFIGCNLQAGLYRQLP